MLSKNHIELTTIFILDNSLGFTGALKAILNSCTTLKNTYHFVFIIPKKSSNKKLIENNGFEVRTLKMIEISKRPLDLLLYLPMLVVNGIKISKWCRHQNTKIIHVNDFYNLLGSFVKLWRPQIGLIIHVRFLPKAFVFPLRKTWTWVALKLSNSVVAVSKAVMDQLPSNKKVNLIYDALLAAEVHAVKKIESTNNSTTFILYLANYIPGKGQDLALRAFKKAYKVNRNLRMRFVGGDLGRKKNKSFKAQLIDYSKVHGLDDAVVFEPFSLDIEKEIKQADIVLNLSIGESFSFTCLEALTYGVPLIASDSGGPKELFEHRKSGILVSGKSATEVSESILSLSADPAKRIRFSQNARAFVSEKFQQAETGRQLDMLYRKSINKNK